MSQHDYVIANDTAANVRADINSALAAIVSNNSGATAPVTTYANQFWYDTTTKILKIRTESNDAWVSIAYLDDAANAFRLLDDTQVVNTSGVQTGLLGDQLTATWQAGTGTTPSLVSPANIKSAINALALTSTSALPAANLTGALPAIDGSALTGLSGGMVYDLLGTIPTTSGSSVTLSGLNLTGYKQLQFFLHGVSGSLALATFLRLNSVNASNININGATDNASGSGVIDLSSGIFSFSTSVVYSGQPEGLGGRGSGGQSGLTTASTSITFTISAGTFDAGSIIVYGVA